MYRNKKYFYNTETNIKLKDAGCGVFVILRLCDFIIVCARKRTPEEID